MLTTVAGTGQHLFNNGECFMLVSVCPQSTRWHQPNVGSMFGQRLPRWPAFIQHRGRHFARRRDFNAPCRPTHHTPTWCRLNVGPSSVTPVQPWTSIVSQHMSTRRKVCRFKAACVFSCLKMHWAFNPKVGLMLVKWRKQRPNIKLALSQHAS